MSVLTLAMMQLSEMNVDDFYNLRTLGMDYRMHGHRIIDSPSESSGISSLSSENNDRDSASGEEVAATSTPNSATLSEEHIKSPITRGEKVNNNKKKNHHHHRHHYVLTYFYLCFDEKLVFKFYTIIIINAYCCYYLYRL